MKKELPHYRIGSSYGGNQEFFAGFSMKMGGCAAQTACECCIYLDKYFGTKLCLIDAHKITKADYKVFGNIMKPYLHPRMSGVDRTQIFIDGFGAYLRDKGSSITLDSVEGGEDVNTAKAALISQIDKGLPVPYLCLNHNDMRFKEYEWHWFLINGYDDSDNTLKVKAVTYGSYEWLDFDALWHTGRSRKGGFILLGNL